MRFMNTAALIIDYVYFCERRGRVLKLGEFAVMWKIASEIAEETRPENREVVIAHVLRDPE